MGNKIAIHQTAPLFYGWNFEGQHGPQRKYSRNGATALMTPGHILLNNELPIQYINVAVWEAINHHLDKAAAFGPSNWAKIEEEVKQQKLEEAKAQRQAKADDYNNNNGFLRASPQNLKGEFRTNLNKTSHA